MEIVNLKEKKVVGLTAKTKNSDPNMTNLIGSLWQRLYGEEVYPKINNKVNEKAIGMYSDYEEDVNGAYFVTVGCEVSKADSIPEGAVVKVIPEGKYAKFVVRGHIQRAVGEFWQKLWDMNLDRNYKCDFEEYQDGNVDNAEIHIYISIN